MRIIETEEEARFRAEVRGWLQANVPREKRPPEGMAQRDFDCAWQRRQYEAGWAGISWPEE
jgi:alkylation response protein AidB-like acyl-CoA dehydrogenase